MKHSKELIQETIKTFSPYYGRQITEVEAEEIANNCFRLFEVLENVEKNNGINFKSSAPSTL